MGAYSFFGLLIAVGALLVGVSINWTEPNTVIIALVGVILLILGSIGVGLAWKDDG